MKKNLLTCVAVLGLAASASAQLADGTVFPDFTRTDINGNVHHLYADLNAGKTVIIDVSATWCAPCWTYHQTGALDSVWAKHGPTGEPGVNATTTDDVVVYWVQGEPQSGMAQLTFNTIGSGAQNTTPNYTTYTRGNWVLGTHYPIFQDSSAQAAYNSAWDINYFPTVYMICRDHLVQELSQPTEAEVYAAVQGGCPNYAPSGTVDAKAAPYQSNSFYVCNAAPTVRFQNYGTNTITSATVEVKDASGAVVSTKAWTGSLATYDVASVVMPSFATTSFGGYKYSVTAAGDTYPANDISVDSVFKVYSANNAAGMPYFDDLTGTITYKYDFPTDGSVGLPNPAWAGCPNPAGVTSNKYLLFDYYDFQAGTGLYDFVVGNFNTNGMASVTFEFDQSYALYSGNASDKMYVRVSKDCGATWQTVWTGSDATLTTHAAVSTQWVPTAASDWAHRTITIPVADTSANMMIKFDGTSAYGNFAWVTNLKLSGVAVSVPEVVSANNVVIAPNPARDMASVNLTLSEAATVNVQVIDAVGRVVNTTNSQLGAGDQKIDLSTSSLPSGLYNVKISVGGHSVTVKQLSVIK